MRLRTSFPLLNRFIARLPTELVPLPLSGRSTKRQATAFAGVSAKVDDSPGWTSYGTCSATGRPHDHDPAYIQEQYADALTAWRKNPIAWRIVSITTDYILGDRIRITSPNKRLNRFIAAFWNHPKNRLDNRLESMCDELARSGDLFILLFRNPADGMSYLRFITKDRLSRIETAPYDWEAEIAYYETNDFGEPTRYPSPLAPDAATSSVICLHYAVNRPIGALLGESDLTTMLPWLMRYSRMLEDRVRLHWAIRSFLWMVTVPANKIAEKQQQYRQPPEAGSIVIKDSSETWEAVAPTFHSADAQHDLKAVRGMIDAGSGYPPHWRGEAADANLATATAMQSPTERHLARRQKYFVFILQDILYHAFLRSIPPDQVIPRELRRPNYAHLFTVQLPEISRTDNESLSRAAKAMAETYQTIAAQLPARSRSADRLWLRLILKFAGEPQDDELLEQILSEGFGDTNSVADGIPEVTSQIKAAMTRTKFQR